MNVFVDFEASSLADRSYPMEFAWVFEDGKSESHLIAPAPVWTDRDSETERIRGIRRETLIREDVARNFPHRPRPRQRGQASPLLQQGGLPNTFTKLARPLTPNSSSLRARVLDARTSQA